MHFNNNKSIIKDTYQVTLNATGGSLTLAGRPHSTLQKSFYNKNK